MIVGLSFSLSLSFFFYLSLFFLSYSVSQMTLFL